MIGRTCTANAPTLISFLENLAQFFLRIYLHFNQILSVVPTFLHSPRFLIVCKLVPLAFADIDMFRVN